MASKKPQNTALELSIQTNKAGQITEVAQMPEARFSSVQNPKLKTQNTNEPVVEATQGKGDIWNSKRHAVWGIDDLLPRTILDKIEQVPMAANAILYNAQALLGKEIIYVKKSDIAKGMSNVSRHFDPNVEAFMRVNNAQTDFFPAQAFDLSSLFNGFSELIFNKGFNKIVQIAHKEAEYCRLSRIVPNYNQYDRQYLYYTADFSRGRVSSNYYDDPTKLTTMPLYDPLDFSFLQNIVKARQPKFAFHSRPRTSRSFYYATMPWQGLYKSQGWVDVANGVPTIVNAMQDNQMGTDTILYVSEEYFKSIYGISQWIAFTPKERQEKFDAFASQIRKELVGKDNVSASLTLMCKEFNGQIVKHIVFEQLDRRAKADTWIPNSNFADQQILQGHNVNPSQIGLMPQGASMDRVSGSSKRESQNTHTTMNTWLQRLMLAPFQLAADFNGWDVLFLVDDVTHTTTNLQENGVKQNNNSLQVGN